MKLNSYVIGDSQLLWCHPAPFITWLGLGAGSGNALLILAGSRKY